MIKITFRELLKAKEALEVATSGVTREIQKFISKHTAEHGVEVHKHLENLITMKKIYTVVEFLNGVVHSAVSFLDVNEAEKNLMYKISYHSGKKVTNMEEARKQNKENGKKGWGAKIIYSEVKMD